MQNFNHSFEFFLNQSADRLLDEQEEDTGTGKTILHHCTLGLTSAIFILPLVSWSGLIPVEDPDGIQCFSIIIIYFEKICLPLPHFRGVSIIGLVIFLLLSFHLLSSDVRIWFGLIWFHLVSVYALGFWFTCAHDTSCWNYSQSWMYCSVFFFFH